jgi:phosphoribosylanthranilate isomerase
MQCSAADNFAAASGYRVVMADDPPRVKICGVTNLEDALLASELGTWAVGMIFYERSPRACRIDDAEAIGAALRRRAEVSGVFVNATLDQIATTSERVGLTLVQLQGDEGPSFCAEVARRTGARVIKAVALRDAGSVRELERFHTDFHLVDGHSAGLRGGTGNTFDWALLAERSSRVPVIVSGGLTAENVGAAILATKPFAVDVASGVEARPGRKDPARLEAFFAAVQAAGTASAPPQPEPAV